MQIDELYQLFLKHPAIQTDTRKLQTGDLFFALKGPSFNGNVFAQQALDAGAAYAITDEPVNFVSDRIIQVADVLTTLQQLAKHHRQQFTIPFIAITGSNGKTTTKELVHEVLSTTFKTYTTTGNLNNHIGIPLTILKVKADAEMAVVEMGANHQKEIESYCKYTLPTHGLITNCGKAHLEGFGGEEGVKKGKGELFEYLRDNNGTAFIMYDYEYLRQMSNGIKNLVTYGTLNNTETIGVLAPGSNFLKVNIVKGANIESITTQLVGDYNLPNVLAAVCLGKYFGVADEKIKTALESYVPTNSRSQLIEKDSNTIILDAYNANPTSMKAAIENFAKMQGDKKILLLGGMMELGEDSIKEHEAIINTINNYTWQNVVLVGGDYYKLKHPYINFENALQAKDWFAQKQFNNTHILIKGSRSMEMERVIA
jgi:UDP-N-acetylmuramoyl-tripeptide--D-alanyl-D-alanine ligase